MRHGLKFEKKHALVDAAGLHVAFPHCTLTSLRFLASAGHLSLCRPGSVGVVVAFLMVVADIANEVVVPATSIAID